MTYIPSITDDVLAEIEAVCRASSTRPSGHGACTNAETLSMIRRLRESEARLWSLCAAHTLRDTDRLAREVSDALAYNLNNMKTGEAK